MLKSIHKKLLIILSCLTLMLAVISIYLFTQLKAVDNTSFIPISQYNPRTIMFTNANSRDTYFTIHNVSSAHNVSKGKGIKVGIMDTSYAYEKHRDIYAGGVNFSGKTDDREEHGYWMTNVLKEIAPDCTVYALNIQSYNEDEKINNMIKAIDWAIENKIDILTYSGMEISESNRKQLDIAVNNAIKQGIVTTFINYDNPDNIYPSVMFPLEQRGKSRSPDINIFSYDYNILFTDLYINFTLQKEAAKSGNDVPFFSYSSTSPVTAGFIAILKSINNALTPKEYKDILIKTSYKMDYFDPNFNKKLECTRVVDIGKAVDYLNKNYNEKQ